MVIGTIVQLRLLVILPCLAAALAAPIAASSSESDTKAVSVSVSIQSRTLLRVSSEILSFNVPDTLSESTAIVEFAAGIRTRRDAEVVLTVEPLRPVDGPGGAADAGAIVSLDGNGHGDVSGVLRQGTPTVAGRWTGSGLRRGQVKFVLRAAASGIYQVPVRFVLTTP